MERVLITASDVLGAVAYWAVAQHPFRDPPDLSLVTRAIDEAAKTEFADGIPSLPMRWFGGWLEIERWVRTVVDRDAKAVMEAWNSPRVGAAPAIMFTSRYDQPRPECDFIDIDAWLRNVALMVWRLAEREKLSGCESVQNPCDKPLPTTHDELVQSLTD